MRKFGFRPLALILLVALPALVAQTRGKQEPQLRLAISEWRHGLPESYHWVEMTVTNVSDEVFLEPGCSESRDMYRMTVLYNGAPLEEKDAVSRHRFESEQAQMCTKELGVNEVKPGSSFQIFLRVSWVYDMTRPGRYDVTVSRETFPNDPDKNVTVKSNTLTIIVPVPGDAQPK